MGPGIPPLEIKIVLESSPLKSVMLVRKLAVGTPDPNPKHLVNCSRLLFLVELSKSYICLNWLSVALVGVGGSDFIGCKGWSSPSWWDLQLGTLLLFIIIFIYIIIYDPIYSSSYLLSYLVFLLIYFVCSCLSFFLTFHCLFVFIVLTFIICFFFYVCLLLLIIIIILIIRHVHRGPVQREGRPRGLQ